MVFQESDLFPPIKTFFQQKGYKVQGEVKDCDVVISREEDTAVIELKMRFNLELLMQATQRQTMFDAVYIAVPRPAKEKGERYDGMMRLVRRLDVGLLFVALDSPMKLVEIVRVPQKKKSQQTKVGQRKRKQVLNEVESRCFSIAVGGVTGEKIPTAYRENAIEILCTLHALGTASPNELHKHYGCSEKSQSILQPNYYKWFQRVERGIYQVSEKGESYLTQGDFPTIVDFYQKEAAKRILQVEKDFQNKKPKQEAKTKLENNK